MSASCVCWLLKVLEKGKQHRELFAFVVVVVVVLVVYLQVGATPQALPATTVSRETFQRNKQLPILNLAFLSAVEEWGGALGFHSQQHGIHTKPLCRCVSFFCM